MKRHSVRIGISGWRYPGWRKKFYPQGLPQKEELAFASRHFSSIEINGSFYSMQSPASYQRWFDATPAGFVFSVKGPRFITHFKKIQDVEVPLANFFGSGVLNLGKKLGPILWQFPPFLKFDAEKCVRFFELLPRDFEAAARLGRKSDHHLRQPRAVSFPRNHRLHYAIEVRNPSFNDPKFFRLLKQNRFALVVAKAKRKWFYGEKLTAPFVYARMHGEGLTYVSGYGERALDFWAKKFRRWGRRRDLYVYFDNDAKVRAPFDAMGLMRRLKKA